MCPTTPCHHSASLARATFRLRFGGLPFAVRLSRSPALARCHGLPVEVSFYVLDLAPISRERNGADEERTFMTTPARRSLGAALAGLALILTGAAAAGTAPARRILVICSPGSPGT